MTRPVYPTWATDATFNDPGQAWNGLANKITPAAGVIAAGHIPGHGEDAETANWWKNAVGAYLAWLDSQMPTSTVVVAGAAESCLQYAYNTAAVPNYTFDGDWYSFIPPQGYTYADGYIRWPMTGVLAPFNGCTITTVAAEIIGIAPLPPGSQRSTLRLIITPRVGSGSPVTYGVGDDTPQNLAAYTVEHTVGVTGMNVVVDTGNYKYVIEVQAPPRANAAFGTKVRAPALIVTRP